MFKPANRFRFGLLALLVATVVIGSAVGVALRRRPLPLEQRIVGGWYGEPQLGDLIGQNPLLEGSGVLKQLQAAGDEYFIFLPDGRMHFGDHLNETTTWKTVAAKPETETVTIRVSEGRWQGELVFVFDGNNRFNYYLRDSQGKPKLRYLFTRI